MEDVSKKRSSLLLEQKPHIYRRKKKILIEEHVEKEGREEHGKVAWSNLQEKEDVKIKGRDELETSTLSAWGLVTEDLDVLERKLLKKVDQGLREREQQEDEKRWAKLRLEQRNWEKKRQELEEKMVKGKSEPGLARRWQKELNDQRIALLEQENLLNERLKERQLNRKKEVIDSSTNVSETERERLIRLGQLTPFDHITGLEKSMETSEEVKGVKESLRNKLKAENHGIDIDTNITEKPFQRFNIAKWEDEKMDNAFIEPVGQAFDFSGSVTKEIDEELVVNDLNTPDDLDKDDYDEMENRRYSQPHLFVSEQYEDDGNEVVYQKRLKNWAREHREQRTKVQSVNETDELDLEQEEYEYSSEDVVFEGNFRVPASVYQNLLNYQRTGIKWLWELHCQNAGGIIGDEMGLGKTIQMVGFLAGLKFSRLLEGPVLIVCPATIMKQWVREFHKWWAPFRVAILHPSGSFEGSPEFLIDRINMQGHILVTTYTTLRIHQSKLLSIEWAYAVLDEGHKIRNPDAEITLACKCLKTEHRIILSGSPIQNSLKELWSLFDFVFPGRLGTLPVFQNQFSIPISLGGYANATTAQVLTAYKCACILRDLIHPYLLRRMKADVATQLPKKNEQVLFCHLTKFQRTVYEAFLKSTELQEIFEGRRQIFFGVDLLRKVCNHPDLLRIKSSSSISDYGKVNRSGKLKVVQALLKLWFEQKHRILLFCQTRQMLDIIEKFVVESSYIFRRMDGNTPIKLRMDLVDEFNRDERIFIFLLTTKVGGLGINLIGANRVLIFDPDWNPSTDIQARERAWRLGQTKEVTIYRLMTTGTIEEKIYHRQIFKQFLTNKILKDPKQKRFFKSNDLRDLFSLGIAEEKVTETAGIFGEFNAQIDYSNTEHKGQSQTNSVVENEFQKISYLDRQDEYQSPQPLDENSLRRLEDDDAAVLSSLFNVAGIHSAFCHDMILDATNSENLILEKDAERIAFKAAAALRSSRFVRRNDAVNVPTWTGRFGSAGVPSLMRKDKPVEKKRFGTQEIGSRQLVNSTTITNKSSSDLPLFTAGAGIMNVSESSASSSMLSSKEILQGLRERADIDEIDQPISSITHEDPTFLENENHRASLVLKIRDFLVVHGGFASSQTIINHFSLHIGKDQVILFRKMLREIAEFRKEPNGSFWYLKSDFI